ncbi:hypothetical protein PQU95_10280 [Vogesella sp. DC21W]|uniref:Uncharacterized protein n=1 Tax=Vogesella aquatica TaxID=2984206 RepID=A0ABT5IYG5_9NEIS|nr:hypothetical protein [Vogesella aquatica]MDC7717597.1 hypothetical protein [Vogesella aquatica]
MKIFNTFLAIYLAIFTSSTYGSSEWITIFRNKESKINIDMKSNSFVRSSISSGAINLSILLRVVDNGNIFFKKAMVSRDDCNVGYGAVWLESIDNKEMPHSSSFVLNGGNGYARMADILCALDKKML